MFNCPNYKIPEQTTYSYTSEEVLDIDEIVREDLMLQYEEELKNGINNADFLDSLLQVIEFYCTGKQYREFRLSIHKEDESDNA